MAFRGHSLLNFGGVPGLGDISWCHVFPGAPQPKNPPEVPQTVFQLVQVPCGGPKRQGSDMCGLSKNATAIVTSWVFYRCETTKVLLFGVYPLWSFAQSK